MEQQVIGWDGQQYESWYEYARQTRGVHVEARTVGIGTLFTAWLPNGYKHTTADLGNLQKSLSMLECRRLEIVGAE